MRLSAKTRYGLSALICLTRNYQEANHTTVISLAEKLNISKIYLEQVFSLLKRSGIVNSSKGSQGGYKLARAPAEISAYDIFSAIETGLIEETKITDVDCKLERALRNVIYDPLDQGVKVLLEEITLEELTREADRGGEEYMFFI